MGSLVAFHTSGRGEGEGEGGGGCDSSKVKGETRTLVSITSIVVMLTGNLL